MSDTIAQTESTENTQQATAQPVKPERTQLEQIDDLLQGKPVTPEKAPAAPEPGGDANKGEQQQQPESEAETTEEEDTSGIDYGKEVPLSNGEKMSIGALKDFYQGHAQRELAMVERENRVMGQYAELQEMSQYLQLPEGARERIAQQQGQYLREQHTAMLEAIPEWKDQAVFERSRGQIFELGKEYGVDLSRVTDHRVVKMLHDYAKLRGQIKAAKINTKPVKSSDPKSPVQAPANKGGELQQRIDRAKQTGNMADQILAVDALLRG